jgi:hypothetical protein
MMTYIYTIVMILLRCYVVIQTCLPHYFSRRAMDSSNLSPQQIQRKKFFMHAVFFAADFTPPSPQKKRGERDDNDAPTKRIRQAQTTTTTTTTTTTITYMSMFVELLSSVLLYYRSRVPTWRSRIKTKSVCFAKTRRRRRRFFFFFFSYFFSSVPFIIHLLKTTTQS